MQRLFSPGKSLFLLATTLLLPAFPALAATYTVTNTNDSGAGSLRQAVLDANGNAGGDTIEFTLGAGTHTITLTSGQITITDGVTIDPPSHQEIIVDGDNNSRVFRITGSGSGEVILRDLRIQNGSASGGAGVLIINSGTKARLKRCQIFQNDGLTGKGGGLGIGATGNLGPEVIVADCGIRENDSQTAGGANLSSGSAIFRNCTFYLNESSGVCGGMRVADNDFDPNVDAIATFVNCTPCTNAQFA